MNTYCMKCKKDTENNYPKMCRTKNNTLILKSKCPVCRIKISRFGGWVGVKLTSPRNLSVNKTFMMKITIKTSLVEAIKKMVKNIFLNKRYVYIKYLKINTQFFK